LPNDLSNKQGSQTPEEMDVEKTPPDTPIELPEVRPSSKDHHHHHHHHHHHKSKSHQPVTLQQVQAQQNKQLKKIAQKQQKQLAQLKQQTPNKFPSTSPPQKTPVKTPSSQKESSHHNLPPTKMTPITPIEKRLLNLSQKSSDSTLLKQPNTSQSQIQDLPKTPIQSQFAKQNHVQQPQTTQLHLEQQIQQLQQQQLQQQLQLQLQQQQHQQVQKHQEALTKVQPLPLPPQQPPPQQTQPMNVSDSPLPQTLNNSTPSATSVMTDSSQAAAPILDHMSSFFQSNQAYNYPAQNYTYQQSFPPPFPQPTLPQGIPQPPQGFNQPSYMANSHFPDSANQPTYNYQTSQPPMMMPPPPTMFHGTPWM